MDGAREVRRSVGWFLLTTASVWGVYLYDHAREGLTGAAVLDASLFTGALMAILLAHEMGHYVVARLHGFETSPPAFIPLPIPGTFGTMGAVIRLRSHPRSRQALLEMGAAGPVAGAVVAFAALWIGVPLTRPGALLRPGALIGVYNDPLVVKLIGIATTGAPPGRYDVYHPLAMAGWVGCLLTAINLVPIGQLDGGHVFNALFPRASRTAARVLLLAALAGSWFYTGWLVWAGLLYVLGASRPIEVPGDPPPPLRSWLVAGLTVVLLVLTFMPVPIEVETFPPP